MIAEDSSFYCNRVPNGSRNPLSFITNVISIVEMNSTRCLYLVWPRVQNVLIVGASHTKQAGIENN